MGEEHEQNAKRRQDVGPSDDAGYDFRVDRKYREQNARREADRVG